MKKGPFLPREYICIYKMMRHLSDRQRENRFPGCAENCSFASSWNRNRSDIPARIHLASVAVPADCGLDCALSVQNDGLFNTYGARLGIGADIARRGG